MIQVKIQEAARRRGITTAYQLQVAASLPPAVAARMWKGKLARMDLDVLSRICRALNCQPGKVLLYLPEESASVNDKR